MSDLPILIYLHGFGSSPVSQKSILLANYLTKLGLEKQYYAPFLPPDPQIVIPQLSTFIEQHRQIILIGSSLGGFYASYLAEQYNLKAVLINPAITPWRDINHYLGFYTCAYSQTTYEIKQEHADYLQQFAIAQPSYAKNFLLLLQTGDEVLDYRKALMKFPDAHHHIETGGSHAFENFVSVIPLILEFAGIQPIP